MGGEGGPNQNGTVMTSDEKGGGDPKVSARRPGHRGGSEKKKHRRGDD